MPAYAVIQPPRTVRRPSPPYVVNKDTWQARGLMAWFPDPGLGRNYANDAQNGPAGFVQEMTSVGGTAGVVRPDFGFGFGGGGANLRSSGAGPLHPAYGFTIAAWAFSTDATAAQEIVGFGHNGAQGRLGLNFGGATAGDPVRAVSQVASSGVAVTGTGYTVRKVHHCVAVFAGEASRAAYIDGGAKGTDTTNIAANTTNMFTIGGGYFNSATPASFLIGGVMEARIYDHVLTDGEVRALYSPDQRWDLYWVPTRTRYFHIEAGGGGSFQAAWARNSNSVLQPGL